METIENGVKFTEISWEEWVAGIHRPTMDEWNDDPPEYLQLIDPWAIRRFLTARLGGGKIDVPRLPFRGDVAHENPDTYVHAVNAEGRPVLSWSELVYNYGRGRPALTDRCFCDGREGVECEKR